MDFSILRAVAMVLRTWPFLLLRLALSAMVMVSYAFGIGTGAGLGWGIGGLWPPDGEAIGALIGAFAGFCSIALVWVWLRVYLVYLLKGGHVAALVAALDGAPLPRGFGQIGFALRVVRARFLEINALFVLDQLIKGAVGAVTALVGVITNVSGLPGLGALANVLNGVIRMSTLFVDELILAYNLRIVSADPWSTAQDALVLYAQNAWTVLRNALVLTVLMSLFALGVFVLLLAPAGALVLLVPGAVSTGTAAVALVGALALTHALWEPFCIACLMQVYFGAIAGQRPDPDWRARLDGASAKFAALGRRAVDAAA
ncbi:MAG: hypothetical protein ABII76_20630 [Pseudomonadota bacterium]